MVGHSHLHQINFRLEGGDGVLNSAERAALWFSSKLANAAMLASLATALSLGMSFLVCFVDLDAITSWGLKLLSCFVMKLQKVRKRIMVFKG